MACLSFLGLEDSMSYITLMNRLPWMKVTKAVDGEASPGHIQAFLKRSIQREGAQRHPYRWSGSAANH